MDKDEEADLIEKHARELSEHFDTVQILATRHDPANEDGTIYFAIGVGNFYARYGQAVEWIIAQDERTRIKARKDAEQ
jgi:hypothetical protein